jgi:hypothetical protein
MLAPPVRRFVAYAARGNATLASPQPKGPLAGLMVIDMSRVLAGVRATYHNFHLAVQNIANTAEAILLADTRGLGVVLFSLAN